MSLDMTFNGSLGNSSGLLGWGSDIGRMWGIGMNNGIQMAHALRDLELRSKLEPSYIEGAYMNNQHAKLKTAMDYAKDHEYAAALNKAIVQKGGTFDPNKSISYGTPVNTTPQQFQRQNTVAPRNTTNTVVGNGVGGSGHTNTAGSWGMNTGSPSMNTTLQQGYYSQYGQGG